MPLAVQELPDVVGVDAVDIERCQADPFLAGGRAQHADAVDGFQAGHEPLAQLGFPGVDPVHARFRVR